MIDDTIFFSNCYGRLQCPHCMDEESNLHHSRIEVFERDEDEKTGVHVMVEDKEVTIDTNIKQNPSPRRNGISIIFWCEQYCETSVLDILQHKGMSYMRWYNGKGFGEK